MSTFLVGESLMRQADVTAATARCSRARRTSAACRVTAWRNSGQPHPSRRRGEARMVDVSDKAATERVAVAEGRVVMSKATLDLVHLGRRQEGRRAGHRAHRRHHGGEDARELIPLCHPLALSKVEVDIEPDPRTAAASSCGRPCKVTGQTGVEMEALTAVSVACLTIYDMVKAVERGMRIEGIHLVEKRGGKSGTYRVEELSMALHAGRRSARPRARRRASRCRRTGRARRRASAACCREDVIALRTQPPAGCLGDGRLRGARRRCRRASPARLKLIGEVAAGRPLAARRSGRAKPRASSPAACCRGRRHRRHPGEHRARRRHRRDELRGRRGQERAPRPGLDFAQGARLLRKGRRLTGRDLVARRRDEPSDAAGASPPEGRDRATGDELVPPGTEPEPGQIVYSNGFALAALARREGADVHRSRHRAGQAGRHDRGRAPRAQRRRRCAADLRRRVGRRLRPGAAGADGRRLVARRSGRSRCAPASR